MVTELPRRTSFSGPALVRLLSRLAQLEVMEPRQTPAARLDEWLGWTESIVLSKVLNAAPPSPAGRGADAQGAVVDANAARTLAARTGGETAMGGSGDDRDSGAVEGAGGGMGRDDRGKEAAVDAGARIGAGADVVDILELARAEYAQVRAALEQAIRAAVAPPAPMPHLQRRQIRGAPKAAGDVDFPSYRRRYSVLQQKMECSIAALRGRLRTLLVAQSSELARLAAVDAAMEQALVEHELRLLAGIPGLLEEHFDRLSVEGQSIAMESTTAPRPPDASVPTAVSRQINARTPAPPEPGPWLEAFRQDMAEVLRAELDLRLQPVEGLMAALRSE